MTPVNPEKLTFYDGRIHPIDKERLYKFETKAVLGRYYNNQQVASISLIEDLGQFNLDFTNVHGMYSEEIPDIDPRSARLFTLWAEDKDTQEVVCLIKGDILLLSLQWTDDSIHDYYFLDENVPYYPMVVISSFRTILKELSDFPPLLESVKEQIELYWRELREHQINTLKKNTDLWRRYVLSFDRIVHFSFLVPSIDRELIDSLRSQNYRTTGVMQLLASPTSSYDQALTESHLKEAKKVIESYSQEN